jgi:phosphohistidine phosphatase
MSSLFVLRHGIAEPRQQGRPDEARELTREGREKLQLVLASAQTAGVGPSVILTSPLVRAVQTAEMAAKALAGKVKAVRTDALLPEAPPERLWQEVLKYAPEGDVLIAGHEPLLSQTICFLLGSADGSIDLKKGAMACLQLNDARQRPRAALRWLITAGVCRKG